MASHVPTKPQTRADSGACPVFRVSAFGIQPEQAPVGCSAVQQAVNHGGPRIHACIRLAAFYVRHREPCAFQLSSFSAVDGALVTGREFICLCDRESWPGALWAGRRAQPFASNGGFPRTAERKPYPLFRLAEIGYAACFACRAQREPAAKITATSASWRRAHCWR